MNIFQRVDLSKDGKWYVCDFFQSTFFLYKLHFLKVTLKNTFKTAFPFKYFLLCYIIEIDRYIIEICCFIEKGSIICIPFPMNSLFVLTAIWIQKITMEDGEQIRRNVAGIIEQWVFNMSFSLLGTRFWSEQ